MRKSIIMAVVIINSLVAMAQVDWKSNPVGAVFARAGGESPEGICAGYDADRAQAIDSRNRILNYAVSNSLTVLGAHVPANGVLF